MNTKKNIRNTLAAAIPSLLSGLLLPASAAADTVLFPVIAVNVPNVTTVVSVMNGPGGSSDKLRYRYRYKDSLTSQGLPHVSGFCFPNDPVVFDRNTSNGDIVSFDASGTLNSGNALFGDQNSYGGSFDIGLSGPVRGYLTVSNCCTAGGAIVEDDGVLDLAGEAVVMDIASGAAWGMKAINDENREGFAFVNANEAGGGVWSALPSNGSAVRRFSFFPLIDWTTRFFVTPLDDNMAQENWDPDAKVAIRTSNSQSGEGVYDREGNLWTPTPIVHEVYCTGAIDLEDMMDSSTQAKVETGGGWSFFRVVSGDAIVYKLEFAVSSSTYGGTVNNGYLLSTYALP